MTADSYLATTELGPFATKLGIAVQEVGPTRCVATMPVEGNTQPLGILHGGANAALAETAGSLAGRAQAVAVRASAAVGVDLSVTHHRAARSGQLTATATAAHLGRTIATYDITIADDAGRRTASARLTLLLLAGTR